MSESNTKAVEVETDRDELRQQLAEEKRQHALTHACLIEERQRYERANFSVAEVEARALEHAAMEFKSPENAWIRAHLTRMAILKRVGAR